ncbi:MAG: hypothetical protein FJW34_01845 [Acidobacteria bacterium]|nr:hypothetical protein [Acidobacteriota bacterium]
MLLILTPLGYTRLPRWDPMVSAIGAVCLAALACLMASLQDGIPLSASVKTLLGWSYGIGAILLMTGWPWWHDLLSAWVKDPRWSRTLGMVDFALPGMILLPVGAVFLQVFRLHRAWPERAYILGGLGLMVLFLGKTWLDLFEIWFAEFISVNWFMAALFWTPVALVVATMGMFFGCLPQEFHRPSWRGSVTAVCYLAAAAMVPVGFCANGTGQLQLADAAALAVAIGILAPASVVTRRWILARFGGGSR